VTVKKFLAIALVAGVLVSGCESVSSNPEKEIGPAGDLIGTSWLATDIIGKSMTEGAKSTLNFVAAGRVAGRGGCNRFFGAVTIDGQSIEFGKIGSTMMACPPPMMEQEKRYLEALGQAKRFEVKDGMLFIYGTGPVPVIQFTQTEPE